MTIKHGNKRLREQTSSLHEQLRWARIQVVELERQLKEEKIKGKDMRVTLAAKSQEVRETLGVNRKLRAMLNDVLLSNAIDYALEVAYTRANFTLFTELKSDIVNEVKKDGN